MNTVLKNVELYKDFENCNDRAITIEHESLKDVIFLEWLRVVYDMQTGENVLKCECIDSQLDCNQSSDAAKLEKFLDVECLHDFLDDYIATNFSQAEIDAIA